MPTRWNLINWLNLFKLNNKDTGRHQVSTFTTYTCVFAVDIMYLTPINMFTKVLTQLFHIGVKIHARDSISVAFKMPLKAWVLL